ncbi:MFS monosaccharide transporter-like protein [Phyllosticta capitalensis]
MGYFAEKVWSICNDKKTQVVLFSSTAISLYGFDQGMMSLINTNKDYLSRMQISAESPLVGVIVAIYYLGCTVGAVFFSWLSDLLGRKRGIFFCLATASLGNLIMFVSGMGYTRGALAVMMLGRIIMGLGVGGIDAVIPVYSSELSQSEARGKALAQEFQMNIFGLNMAFAINLGVTIALGKSSQWAWRIPIIVMQAYPILLFAFIERLPESPRWCIFNGLDDAAREACEDISPGQGEKHLKELKKIHEQESDESVSYVNMITPSHPQFHPTIITIMVQICQALTGYGAVSVYGPQIFELLGFATRPAEYLTMSNYVSYLVLMTGAWLLIDAVGRRSLMLWGSSVLTSCFLLLALFGGLAMHAEDLDIPNLAVAVPGIVALFTATGAFGIGWLATVWLAPTEIVPTTARAQMAAISVIVWGVANFAITLLTPLMFNNLKYWLFLVFAASNAVAGLWTWAYLPETGGRSFEENQRFFEDAAKEGTWRVGKVEGGEYLRMPYPNSEEDVGERAPLLSRVRDQL